MKYFKDFVTNRAPSCIKFVALGNSAEQKISIAETLVCYQKFRSDWTSRLCQESLQACQGIPGQGGTRLQVPADERCEGKYLCLTNDEIL